MIVDAIVDHLVGDYLLQDDFMAKNKKKSSFVCGMHCLAWALCVAICGLPWSMPFRSAAPIILILFVTHFIQDRTNIIRTWMTWRGQEEFASGPLSPWSIIVVDNVWHIVTIFIVWRAFGISR